MKDETRAVMFSSKTDLWATPAELFNELDREFHFTVDVCALPENAKCRNYYTPEIDGLTQKWGGRHGVTRRMVERLRSGYRKRTKNKKTEIQL